MALWAPSVACDLGRNSAFPKFHLRAGWISFVDLAVLKLCPGILASCMCLLQLSIFKRGSVLAQLKIF